MAEELVLDTDWNITKAQAKAQKLQREFEVSKQKAANIKEEMQKTADNIEQSKLKQQQLTAELDQSSQKLDDYLHGQIQLTDKQVQSEKKRNAEIQKRLEKEELYQTAQESSLKKQEISLNKQNAKTSDIGDQILLNTRKQNKFTQAFEKSSKSADRFAKRIKSLIASALFFSVITKAFTALRNEFGKLITETGTKTASLVAELNGSLSVLGRTLYEVARPAIEWILQKLIQVVNVITYGIAKMLGKSIEEMKKLAKQTKKVGEETKKATAGFDTLQTIDSSSSGVGTDFSALTQGISNEVALLMAILSGAVLVLGVILTFSGINIPLGLGLIAIGAIGLAASIAANWDYMEQKTRDKITGIMGIGGALFILLGIALLFTGAGIPLGIGLIFLGTGLLYGSYKLTPGNSFVEKVKNLWENVKEVVKGAIAWLRKNVIDDLLGKGFGQAFEDLFKDISILCEDIIALFSDLFKGDLKNVGKDLLNILVGLINIIIDAVNLAWQFILGGIRNSAIGWSKTFAIFGAKDASSLIENSFKKTEKWLIPHVPRLATGAILPGGSPMLAWVNDQPKGQPYIEGSIDNIAAAFEKYLGGKNLGNQNITIEAKGNWAQFIKWMNLQIKQEDKRASIF